MKLNKNWKKRAAAILSAGVLAVSGTAAAIPSVTASAQPSSGTYGDALKLSLYFFDGNQCGFDVDDNCLTWRGNCHTYDATASLSSAKGLSSSSLAAIKEQNGGSDTVDVSGGYHDAGDHLKFSMTMGYSATCLAWSYYNDPDAYIETDSEDHLMYILKEMCDYFMKVTYLDDSDNVIAFCYMVGGDQDHNVWTAPEIQDMDRPTYWADASNPSADASGQMASALAATSMAFQDKNPEYAAECLKYANALQAFTAKYPSATYDGIGAYYSSGSQKDDVAWSDLWCHLANGTIDSYSPIVPSNGVYNGEYDYWVFSWDKLWGGYACLLSSLGFGDAFTTEVKFEMDKLNSNYSQAYYPIGGGWGASRYNCAWQLYAMTYASATGNDQYNTYASGQMDYLLGSNSQGRSYLLGFSDTYPQNIHHRAANPNKAAATYTLYGALVGGPTDASGSYDDNTDSYSCTEPALDYNGSFALAIVGLYKLYGGDTTLADATIASASEINSDYVFDYGATESEEKPTTTTATTEETTITTEETTTTTTGEEADLVVDPADSWKSVPDTIYVGESAEVSINTVFGNYTWYSSDESILSVEGNGNTATITGVSEGTVTLHTERLEYTIQVLPVETDTTTVTTDATTTTTTTQETTTAPNEETTSTTTTTTAAESDVPATLYGDVNLDGSVDITDAVLLNKAAAGAVTLTDFARSNADCNLDTNVDQADATMLMKFLVHLISSIGVAE